ncbi:MAG: DUF3991 domain-containing protein, partial [Symploca sp. SIO1C4]|nr:DUF3991 domain-containing protein [Symploca sp. SIO1C4]
MSNQTLIRTFADHFTSGGALATIIEARQQAELILGEKIPPGTANAKQVDESVEAAIVRAARYIIQNSETTHQAYESLVNLHSRQPALNVRSSTSVAQQAYSTPIPIAYLASTLAGITPNSTVYEPAGGHGALLLNSDRANATVNELNPERAADLRAQGYSVTENDASIYRPEQQHDVIIANPPFGRVRDEQGNLRRFKLPGNRRGTTQIDQAIAFQALESMKDDGRAVLILGGKLGGDEATRSNRYNTLESRGFFKALYEQYNVTQHFSIWGELYRKQGAGFPIDVIVILGRGSSGLALPAAAVPPIYRSFAQFKELMPNDRLREPKNNLSGLRPLSTGLEAAGRGQPGVISRPSPSRTGGDERRNLRKTDDSANRVDDSPLAGTEPGNSGGNPSETSQSFKEPVILPRNSRPLRKGKQRTQTSVVVDSRMGGNLRQPQRNPNLQVPNGRGSSTALPGNSFRGPTGAPAVAGGTRRGDDPGELVELPDLRDGGSVATSSRRDASSDSKRIQRMAVPDVNIQNPETQPLQVPYVPRSRGNSANTIIPANMAAAAQTALDRFEQEQGDIDEYVQQNLGYETKEQLWQVLYAEQIDSVALAFSQLDKGNIFLNGDQTGNGKGRFGAANLIRAQRQGYIPVFVTHKADLYNSMINDLADIGHPGFIPFATNNNLSLKLDDGRRLKTAAPLDQEAEMLRLFKQGGLNGEYGAIFSTYSQLQTIGNKEPFRREFFRAIAPKAVFIFDESHQAGGSTNKEGQWQTNRLPDRAEFVRELVDQSAGAVFMSATATKDPAVMDLYARRSDARRAVSSLSTLESLLKSGGVPLQQMVATKFVGSGQMLRRERSMTDISFDAKVVPVDREVADGISAIMRAIDSFDRTKEEIRQDLDKQLKQEAKQVSEDNAIGEAGVQSINFTSLMHNAIDQGLLCQKAEATVQEAISSLEKGEKPLIAVASTMDTFIKQYAEDKGLNPGDPIDITFGDVLHRYLERSRDVIISDHEGQKNRHRLTDEELGEGGVAAYEEALELIDNTDLSSIPLSSIDYIRWRLTQQGYQVDEITGRKNIIEYTANGSTGYGRRSSRETSPQGKIKIVNQFNSGELDIVILNKSGSTGINLHASEKFADQRPRHMIVAQAERDINEVMQMLGRANRFGQVVPPHFTLLMSDLPAEKRLGALLAKKMASLNANTTASREGKLSVTNVVDFMNVYGEEVITEILEDDPELESKLSFPSNGLKGESDIELISRVTGRIPLLSIVEQEQLYSLIESETLDLIAQKEAMGESVLQAEQLDLDARTIARMEVIPDDSGIKSEFTGPVYLEVVDAKVLSKPLSQLQVVNRVRENLGLSMVESLTEHDFDALANLAAAQAQETVIQLKHTTEEYRRQALLTKKNDYARDKLNERLDLQLSHVTGVLEQYPPGTAVRVVSPEQGNITYGIIARVWQKNQNGSPSAPTNWKAQILTDNQARQITIPLSKFNSGKENSLEITPQEVNWDGELVYEAFDQRQQRQNRTQRQIFTGNILKAYEKYPRGKLVNYTDNQGGIRQGLVMPAGFDIQESLRSEHVPFAEPYQVRAFITDITQNQGSVKTLDENLTIKTQAVARLERGEARGFVLQTPKSSQAGGKYFLDKDIITAAGSEFYSVSDRMEVVIPAAQIEAVLNVVMKEKGYTLAAFDFQDLARDYLGVNLPSLEPIEVLRLGSREPGVGNRGLEELESNFNSRLPRDQLETTEKTKGAEPELPQIVTSNEIVPPQEQRGGAEKNIAKFLNQTGLFELVMANPDFHLRIENKPYIPLVVERHDNQLYLTHYLTENGDTYIDSEMVFYLSESGRLSLQETAVSSIGGEYRVLDRNFAQVFSRNILQQGFAEAAQQLLSTQVNTQEVKSSPSLVQEVTQTSPNPETTEIETPTLFDVKQFAAHTSSGVQADYQLDIAGDELPLPIRRVPEAATSPSTIQLESISAVSQPSPSHSSLGKLAEQVRDADLETVAADLGLAQDRHDKHKWKDGEHTISINGSKFIDWQANRGGGGAIDLVMHVRKVDFQGAVEWLSGQSLSPHVSFSKQQSQIESAEPRPLEMPTPNQEKWKAVRQYLVESRGLPAVLVDHIHERGLVYADDKQNAVFVRYASNGDGREWERKEPIGASLRGTRGENNSFHGLVPGSWREQGWFWIGAGKGEVKRVFLTESPIDALSLATIDKNRQTAAGITLYLSTDGSGAVPTEVLKRVLERGGQVVAAFDVDQAGEEMAWRLAQELPGVSRVSPAYGKDWNERLLMEGKP